MYEWVLFTDIAFDIFFFFQDKYAPSRHLQTEGEEKSNCPGWKYVWKFDTFATNYWLCFRIRAAVFFFNEKCVNL